MLDPDDDVLDRAEPSFGDPARHLRFGFRVSPVEVEHEEPLHPRPIDEQCHVIRGPARRTFVVVLRDRTADHDARVTSEPGEHRIEDLAADVVEIHIDPVGALLLERDADVLVLVVDRRVEAQVLDEEPAFLRAARDADDATPFDLRDLPNHHPDGACRR